MGKTKNNLEARQECEARLLEKLKEMAKIHAEYNPGGDYLVACVNVALGQTRMNIQNAYLEGDQEHPINLMVTEAALPADFKVRDQAKDIVRCKECTKRRIVNVCPMASFYHVNGTGALAIRDKTVDDGFCDRWERRG